ncbi:type II secretion system minor pseudopilin GspK [Aliivibrio kagoshimensis]|uniref:type II secretion system minor pseudopilin GspK n=1 Tax=Aliivibrio kagoshimensis TaxID=2910230 RepID=UPI003D0E0DFC
MLRQKQRGVALIVVLLLLAIMTTIAAQMSDRMVVQFHRSENQSNHQQAYWYSVGVEALAIVAIKQSVKDNPDSVNLSQVWARDKQSYPLDYGTAVGYIVDKQACFNLNALAAAGQGNSIDQRPYLVRVWMNILENAGADNYIAETVADSSWEFIDSNQAVQSLSGVEDSSYEAFSPPYVTPNGLIADISELRAVNGVSATLFTEVQALICALPTSTWQLNINTIKEKQAEIISALFSPMLSLEDAQSVISDRPYEGWKSVDDFLATTAISVIDDKVKNSAKPYLTVVSDYFELDSEVMVEQSRVRVRSLLHSEDENTVNVIRRRYGGFSERSSDNKTQ